MTAGPPPSGWALLAALRGHLLLDVCTAHRPFRRKPETKGRRWGRGECQTQALGSRSVDLLWDLEVYILEKPPR